MEAFWNILDGINGVLWHQYVLFTLLAVGVLFTFWSGFCQYRALTHGIALVRGKYDDKSDPGAINHFQALSTALSGTVGLGNIAGVSVAVALGGPGAVFWMWVVGLVGMALKLTEVTQSMLYRDTSDPDNPKGGPMWVCKRGFEKISPGLAPLGIILGGIFCITVLISTITGGNMFQAWSVGEITKTYIPTVEPVVCGIIMAVITGTVIIGGIKRIGSVTGRLVPFMCALYLLAAIVVLAMNMSAIPSMFALIFKSALPPALGGVNAEPTGAFLGGTFGYAFLWGMKRALFSNEAGQGSSPIAHSAAKTDEPAREGIVAGLEPFIDTIVVCTITALVVLSSGAWNREAAAQYDATPAIVAAEPAADGSARWVPDVTSVPAKSPEAARNSNKWRERDDVMILVKGDNDPNTGRDIHHIKGKLAAGEGDALTVVWEPFASKTKPEATGPGLFMDLKGPSLTGHAFDRAVPGMGMWIVMLACWLFAISTIIAWSYYGEQAIVFLIGPKAVMPYKVIYCLAIVVATLPFIKTDKQLDSLTALGTGVMLFANFPIMLIFGRQAMKTYHDYNRRLKSGELLSHAAPPITDVVEGKDVK